MARRCDVDLRLVSVGAARALAANDQIVVCDDMTTQASYIFEIDLTTDTRAGARPDQRRWRVTTMLDYDGRIA